MFYSVGKGNNRALIESIFQLDTRVAKWTKLDESKLETPPRGCNMCIRWTEIGPKSSVWAQRRDKWLIYNHLPNQRVLGTKSRLYELLTTRRLLHTRDFGLPSRLSPHSFLPVTYPVNETGILNLRTHFEPSPDMITTPSVLSTPAPTPVSGVVKAPLKPKTTKTKIPPRTVKGRTAKPCMKPKPSTSKGGKTTTTPRRPKPAAPKPAAPKRAPLMPAARVKGPISGIIDPSKNPANLWIVKPTNFNRGRGIRVVDSVESTLKHVEEVRSSFKRQSISFLVQKYIENPLLVEGRKFDLRVFALVRSDGSAWVYRRGYARLASVPFELGIGCAAVHLTNNAVQKHMEEYDEEANMYSFERLADVIAADASLPEAKRGGFWSSWRRIQSLVGLVLYTAGSKLVSQTSDNCFELFGFDFMLDTDLKPWLIEVNCNPCMAFSSSTSRELLPLMLDDMFVHTMDVLSKYTPRVKTPPRPNGWRRLMRDWAPALGEEK
eukprot:gnl/Dysnectes_brevis/4523_a6116_739.p1 GENE.gnl/Dysnectes_brevis/4523_a6116_739~~gnl/Dysnectes_brevis/4523_a6116_739.p1  ORF type:complete len:492 (+),score=22.32 gnl/Dysnectes_brevis/4523_a6116_739:21-1496(+)